MIGISFDSPGAGIDYCLYTLGTRETRRINRPRSECQLRKSTLQQFGMANCLSQAIAFS